MTLEERTQQTLGRLGWDLLCRDQRIDELLAQNAALQKQLDDLRVVSVAKKKPEGPRAA